MIEHSENINRSQRFSLGLWQRLGVGQYLIVRNFRRVILNVGACMFCPLLIFILKVLE